MGIGYQRHSSKRQWEQYRFELIKAALTGLLADHEEHPEERQQGESCSQAVARLACEHADAVIERLKKEYGYSI